MWKEVALHELRNALETIERLIYFVKSNKSCFDFYLCQAASKINALKIVQVSNEVYQIRFRKVIFKNIPFHRPPETPFGSILQVGGSTDTKHPTRNIYDSWK